MCCVEFIATYMVMLISIKPAILGSKDLELKAIYSRSLKSAKDLAGRISTAMDLYSEDSSQGFEDILKRDDIQALIIGQV